MEYILNIKNKIIPKINMNQINMGTIMYFLSIINTFKGFEIFAVPCYILALKYNINIILSVAVIASGLITIGEYSILFRLLVIAAITSLVSYKKKMVYDFSASLRNIYTLSAFYSLLYFILDAGNLVINGYISAYSISSTVIRSILIYTSTIIFQKGFKYLTEDSKSKCISKELGISLISILICVMIGMRSISINGVYLQEIVLFLILQISAYVGGSVIGGITGTLCTIPVLIGVGADVNMTFLSLIGLGLGTMKKSNKIIYSLISGIILIGTNILFIDSMGSTMNFVYSILIVEFIFILIPKEVYDYMEKATCDIMKIRKKTYYENIKNRVCDKLNECSLRYKELSKTIEKTLDSNLEYKVENKEIIDKIIKDVCQNCPHKEECWQSNFYNTYKTILEVFNGIQNQKDKNIILKRAFKNNCINKNRLLEQLELEYKKVLSKRYIDSKLESVRSILQTYSNETSNQISEMAHMIGSYKLFRTHIEDKIREEFEKNDLNLNDVFALQNENGKYEITLTVYDKYRDKIKMLERILKAALGKSFTCKANSKVTNTNLTMLRFFEKEKIKLNYGIFQISKKDEYCGDRYSIMKYNRGETLISIADGMGKGEKAYKESKLALELLENMISIKFDEKFITKFINTILMNNDSDNFTTLDVCLVDLYNSSARFFKNGSIMTYIKSDSVEVIEQKSLPIGIVDKLNTNVIEKELKDGDIILMMSDGAIDNINNKFEKESYLKRLVERSVATNPQELVNELGEKILSSNVIKDDMTLIAIEVKNMT